MPDDAATKWENATDTGAATQPASSSDAASKWENSSAATSTSTTPAPYNPIHAGAVAIWNALNPDMATVRRELEPTPGTEYGGLFTAVTPEEAKAGTYHFAMGSIPRSILQGLTTPVSEWGTVDPIKGSYGADPNALLAALSIAGPLGLDTGTMATKFGGPLSFTEAPSAEAVAGVNAIDPEVLRRAQLRPTTGAPSEPSGIPPPSQPPTAVSPGTSVGSAPPVVGPASSAEVKPIFDELMRTARNNGGTLPPSFTDKWVDTGQSLLKTTEAGEKFGGPLAPDVSDGLEKLRGNSLSLDEVQDIDSRLGTQRMQALRAGNDDLARRLREVQGQMRDQIDNLSESDVEGGKAGFDALVQARRAWQQYRKMQDVEDMAEASGGKAQPDTSYKTRVDNFLLNDRNTKGWSDEEKQALKDSGNSGFAGGALKVIGSGLVPYVSAGIGATVGTPFGPVLGPLFGSIAGSGIGYAGTRAAQSMMTTLRARRVQNALDVLGRGVPQSPLAPP